MIEWCRVLAKYSIFIVNLIIAVCGVILIIVGMLDKAELTHFRGLVPEDYKNILLAPTSAITIGGVIFVVALIGCAGAIREKAWMLDVFAILLVLIFFTQIALGIYACAKVANTASLERSVEESLTPVFDVYYTGRGHPKDFVDILQRELHCCGLKGSSYWTDRTTEVPKSCTDKRTDEPFKDGCSKKFSNFLHKSAIVIGITVLVLCGIEVLGSIFAYFLARNIRYNEY